jgi:proteasome lid subunit RPN8/RPN11
VQIIRCPMAGFRGLDLLVNGAIRNKIIRHGEAEYPREACGVVIMVNDLFDYVPCQNIAPNGHDNFTICPIDFAAAEDSGKVIAIVHTHPNASATPSQADLVGCEKSQIPWIICSIPTCDFQYIEPKGYSPDLVGRVFSHGVLDCYTLIRDYYRQRLDIVIPDFERVDGWWESGKNIYVENFAKAGFRRIIDQPIKEHDVLLMQIQAPVSNHGAVFVGGDKILHHLYGRLSKHDVYGGYYAKHTTHVLRHEKL